MRRSFLFALAALSALLTSPQRAEAKQTLPIYLFTDFAAGQSMEHAPVNDWQTAIELASVAWKTVQLPHILINDTAAPLNPALAGAQIEAAFPYHRTSEVQPLHTIVVHVIDPGVGNASSTPRAAVWRRDGVLFIGPDNGTLSQACPLDSIAGIWELDAGRLAALTGTDISAGGTFHGRDLFSLAAYLLASEQVFIDDIATRYDQHVLRYRLTVSQESDTIAKPVFERIRTDRWDLHHSENLFADAYFLAVVQSPLYNSSGATPAKQLFAINERDDSIAIVNRKTGNIYIGPNNGVGTAFFTEFDARDVWITPLSNDARNQILSLNSTDEIFYKILQLPPLGQQPNQINLKASLSSSTHHSLAFKARVWIDAYGNLKTTLTSEQLHAASEAGYTEISAELNGITHSLALAESFAEVEPGQPFIYAGSSGAVGPNPHRTNRYVEVSCNGSNGQFGATLFTKEDKAPQTGQLINFYFTKKTN